MEDVSLCNVLWLTSINFSILSHAHFQFMFKGPILWKNDLFLSLYLNKRVNVLKLPIASSLHSETTLETDLQNIYKYLTIQPVAV